MVKNRSAYFRLGVARMVRPTIEHAHDVVNLGQLWEYGFFVSLSGVSFCVQFVCSFYQFFFSFCFLVVS